MIIYELTDEEAEFEPQTYFATLREAREANVAWCMGDGIIDRLTLVDLPPRQLAAKLLNGRGWVAKRERVT